MLPGNCLWFVILRYMVVRIAYTIRPVNRYSSTNTENVVPTSLYYRIVWYCHPSTVFDGVIIKVSRVIMVSSDKHNPNVRLRQAFTVTIIHILVVVWLFLPEATVTCHDDDRVRHLVLNAAPVYELVELAMNISTHHNTLGIREIIEDVLLIHIFIQL